MTTLNKLVYFWKKLVSKIVIKQFCKLVPHINLKQELMQEDPDLPLKILLSIIHKDKILQKSVLNTICEIDQELFVETWKDFLEDNTEVNRKIILNFYQKNPSEAKNICLNQLFQNEAETINLIKKMLLQNRLLMEKAALWIFSCNPDFYHQCVESELRLHSSYYFNQNIFSKQIIELLKNSNTFILGGFSNCIYDASQSFFFIDGWFLPKNNYSEVVLYLNNHIIGTAALGVKRIDVYRDYPLFNEKYSGFKLTLPYKKSIINSDIVELKVYKNKVLVKKAKIGITFSSVNSSEIINSKNTPEEYLELKKNSVLIDRFYMNELKNIFDSFDYLDKKIRDQQEHNWILNRIYNNTIISSILLKPHSGYIESFEGLEELLHYSSNNTEFYKFYLQNNNYTRIISDYNFICKYISNEAKILDIGAIPPLLENMLIKNCKDITVLDPNAKDFSDYFEKYNIKYINNSIFTMDVLPEKYSFIIFAEVLEHLSGNLIDVIEKITNTISDKGYLYITTPNLRSISGVYGICKKSSGLASKYKSTVLDQYYRFKKNGYYGHLREYTPQEVVDLIESFGFTLIETTGIAEYRNENPLVIALEESYPHWRLFQKYLFQKNKDINKDLSKRDN